MPSRLLSSWSREWWVSRRPPVSLLQVTMIKAAEAEAESKFLQGQGMARQRQASGVGAGLRAS